MFEPSLEEWAWGEELVAAAGGGADAVVGVARRVRRTMADDEADEAGVRLVELLDLPVDPPGRAGALASAARVFAGPRTVAAVGAALRDRRNAAEWKVHVGLEILEHTRGRPTIVQLVLCARDGEDFALLQRSTQHLRRYPGLMREILETVCCPAPAADIERFLALMLERAMIEGTRFRAGALTEAGATPARAALGRVLWAQFDGRVATRTFMLDPESDSFVDADWNTVTLPNEARIGVVHPAELPTPERDAWGLTLAESEVTGLFPQLDRECPSPQPRFPYRDIQREVPHWELVRFLCRHGWTRDGESVEFVLPIRAASLVLDTRIADRDLRRMQSIWLRGGDFGKGIEDRVTYAEALAATLELLDEFAPDLI